MLVKSSRMYFKDLVLLGVLLLVAAVALFLFFFALS
jgi:hypothetical protein